MTFDILLFPAPGEHHVRGGPDRVRSVLAALPHLLHLLLLQPLPPLPVIHPAPLPRCLLARHGQLCHQPDYLLPHECQVLIVVIIPPSLSLCAI